MSSTSAAAALAAPGEGGAPGERRQPGNAATGVAACEELLADMWRRRTAVEQALRVATELYTEAEAAAMQAYAQEKQRAGEAPTTHTWWKEPGPLQRPALTPAQRDEVRAARRAAPLRARRRRPRARTR